PIIMLSVRGEEDDVVKGLQFGADDYVVKPFSPRQLVARAEAVLRRSDAKVVTASPIQAGDLSLDPLRNEVVRDGEVIAHLTKMECRLLELMMINQNQVLPFDTLIDAIWGPGGGDRMMLKQLIYRVRRKIELQPSQPFYLLTYAGTGYGFDPS
ncbi:MAG: response regulator transcription factor, partial [Anaerolineales bacterium]